MPSVAFAAPLLPGKSEQDRNDIGSCTPGGERQAAYEASRARHGITREAVWIQPTPAGDLAVVYIEADDLQAAFAGLGSLQDPFDVWFRDQVRDVHGINLEDGFPAPRADPRLPRRSRGSELVSAERRRASGATRLTASGGLRAAWRRRCPHPALPRTRGGTEAGLCPRGAVVTEFARSETVPSVAKDLRFAESAHGV